MAAIWTPALIVQARARVDADASHLAFIVSAAQLRFGRAEEPDKSLREALAAIVGRREGRGPLNMPALDRIRQSGARDAGDDLDALDRTLAERIGWATTSRRVMRDICNFGEALASRPVALAHARRQTWAEIDAAIERASDAPATRHAQDTYLWLCGQDE